MPPFDPSDLRLLSTLLGREIHRPDRTDEARELLVIARRSLPLHDGGVDLVLGLLDEMEERVLGTGTALN